MGIPVLDAALKKPEFIPPNRKLLPPPKPEDWKAYLKSVLRNGTEWGAK